MKISEAEKLLLRAEFLDEVSSDILEKSQMLKAPLDEEHTRSKVIRDAVSVSRQAISQTSIAYINENEDVKQIIDSYSGALLSILNNALIQSEHLEIELESKLECLESVASDIEKNSKVYREKWSAIENIISEDGDLDIVREKTGERPESLSVRRMAQQHLDTYSDSES